LPGGTRKVANTVAAWICSSLRRATRSMFRNLLTGRLWNKASVSAQEKERITGEVIPCNGFRQAER
jgi:hypothetical protein